MHLPTLLLAQELTQAGREPSIHLTLKRYVQYNRQIALEPSPRTFARFILWTRGFLTKLGVVLVVPSTTSSLRQRWPNKFLKA